MDYSIYFWISFISILLFILSLVLLYSTGHTDWHRQKFLFLFLGHNSLVTSTTSLWHQSPMFFFFLSLPSLECDSYSYSFKDRAIPSISCVSKMKIKEQGSILLVKILNSLVFLLLLINTMSHDYPSHKGYRYWIFQSWTLLQTPYAEPVFKRMWESLAGPLVLCLLPVLCLMKILF